MTNKKVTLLVLVGSLILGNVILAEGQGTVLTRLINFWSSSGNDIFNVNPGNVGIGTQNPQQKLEVDGAIRVNPSTSIPPKCDEQSRGSLWVQKAIGNDYLLFCKKVTTNNLNDSVINRSERLPQPTDRLSCAENTLTSKIYCFGGVLSSGSPTDQIIEFSPLLGTVVRKSAVLPSPRYYFSCSEFAPTHKIYCFGGQNREIVEYDPSLDAVRIMSAQLPLAISSLSCTYSSMTQKIYCFGGVDHPVYEYDPIADVLIQKTATFPHSYGVSCAEGNLGKLYCFGGSLSRDIYEYDPQQDLLVRRPVQLPLPTEYHSCVRDANVSGRIFCFGGQQSGSFHYQTYRYDSIADNIDEGSPLPTARAFLSCATGTQSKSSFCLGGYGNSGYLAEIVEYIPSGESSTYNWILVV